MFSMCVSSKTILMSVTKVDNGIFPIFFELQFISLFYRYTIDIGIQSVNTIVSLGNDFRIIEFSIV